MAHDILIYGDIGPSYSWWDDEETGITGEWIADQLAAIPIGESEVNIRVNSPGGVCSEGFTIRNQLRVFSSRKKLSNQSFKLNGIVDGYAYSAASVVLLGCDKIIMMSGSLMMIHNCSGVVWGNAQELLDAAAYYQKVDGELASILALKTGKKESDMKVLLDAETYFSPEEAKAIGLCDDIDTAVVSPENRSRFGETFTKAAPNNYKKTYEAYKQVACKLRNKQKTNHAPDMSFLLDAEIERDIEKALKG